MVTRSIPEDGDVVVRQKRGNPSTVYLLGTLSAPDQFIVRTREGAVAKALRFAERQHVRAWLTDDRDDFVLLEDFREAASA